MIERIKKLFEAEKQKGVSTRSILLSQGFSEYDFSEWARGKSKPTIEKLVKLADYFQVSLDYLCGRTDDPKMQQLPSGEGSRSEITKIIEGYLAKNNLQPTADELAVALNAFASIIDALQKSKK